MNTEPRLQETIVGEMATILRERQIDLNDERAVISALCLARFRSGDIVLFCDKAVAKAKERTNAR